jgi:sporulation protein YlmC with PRC-barrel domain
MIQTTQSRFLSTSQLTSTGKTLGKTLGTTLAGVLAAAVIPASIALAQIGGAGSAGTSSSETGASPSAPPTVSPTPAIEPPMKIERTPGARDPATREGGARESAAPRQAGEGANALIGMPVVTSDGQKIGDVAKVATDANGKVREIELKVGGFLGMGGKSVMVPGDKLNASDKKQVVLLMTSEQAKQLVQ